MMTDEMYGACAMMVNALLELGEEQRNVGSAMLDMLMDFSEGDWCEMSDEERFLWIQRYIDEVRCDIYDHRS